MPLGVGEGEDKVRSVLQKMETGPGRSTNSSVQGLRFHSLQSPQIKRAIRGGPSARGTTSGITIAASEKGTAPEVPNEIARPGTRHVRKKGNRKITNSERRNTIRLNATGRHPPCGGGRSSDGMKETNPSRGSDLAGTTALKKESKLNYMRNKNQRHGSFSQPGKRVHNSGWWRWGRGGGSGQGFKRKKRIRPFRND